MISRRRVLGGMSLLPLAAAAPWLLEVARGASAAGAGYRFFSAHEADVIIAATARLIPGPQDDPLEIGHPGAREAGVVNYIDTMLAALTFTPEEVHAGGPWSNRHGGTTDYFARFVPLTAAQRYGWSRRLAALQAEYRAGIAALDAAASTKDFSQASPVEQDSILAGQSAAAFVTDLFGHAIEGMYSAPEYGGNAGLVGWTEISFPGDVQPQGYTPQQVEQSDGNDPVDPAGLPLIHQVLAQLPSVTVPLP